jgi:hypothetical protein
MSLYDDDIDPQLRYAHRRPRLVCRCHSASEEPCLACQDDLMGDDGPTCGCGVALTAIEQAKGLGICVPCAVADGRIRELLAAPTDETLYATNEELRAARDAALSEGD